MKTEYHRYLNERILMSENNFDEEFLLIVKQVRCSLHELSIILISVERMKGRVRFSDVDIDV